MSKDIVISKNKVAIQYADALQIEDIVRTDAGHFKWATIFGTGAVRTHQGNNVADCIQTLRIQAKALKLSVQKIQYQQGQWNIQLTAYNPSKAS